MSVAVVIRLCSQFRFDDLKVGFCHGRYLNVACRYLVSGLFPVCEVLVYRFPALHGSIFLFVEYYDFLTTSSSYGARVSVFGVPELTP